MPPPTTPVPRSTAAFASSVAGLSGVGRKPQACSATVPGVKKKMKPPSVIVSPASTSFAVSSAESSPSFSTSGSVFSISEKAPAPSS